MKRKQYKGIWFYGLAGSGKTFASRFISKEIDKKVIFIDGDKVRKYISTDLGYSLNERKIQVKRVLGISKIIIESGFFPVASTVYLDEKILKKNDKFNIETIRIKRSIKKIKSLRKIYKTNTNVVGKDIKLNKLKTITIKNTGDKRFCKELLKLAKRINT